LATPNAVPGDVPPGLTAISPAPSKARPLIVFPAPSGSAVTGIGSTATMQGQRFLQLTLPPG